MRKIIFFFFLVACWQLSRAQGFLKRTFPTTAFTLQYAGSTGLVTIGVSKVTPKNKLEIGLFYGRTPREYGNVRSLSLKLTYNPIHLLIRESLQLEPFQLGFFFAQNFGYNIHLSWDNRYPKGYYWWPNSLRTHIFISSQIAIVSKRKHLDRIALYWEANTNDLYLYSYLSNLQSLTPYDIVFFGLGAKVYVK